MWIDRLLALIQGAIIVAATFRDGVHHPMWEILLVLGIMPLLLFLLNRWTGLIFSIAFLPHVAVAYMICDMAYGGDMLHVYHEWAWVLLLYVFPRTVQLWVLHINQKPPSALDKL